MNDNDSHTITVVRRRRVTAEEGPRPSSEASPVRAVRAKEERPSSEASTTPISRNTEKGPSSPSKEPSVSSTEMRRLWSSEEQILHEVLQRFASRKSGGDQDESKTAVRPKEGGKKAATGGICKTCKVNRTANHSRLVCDECTNDKFRDCKKCSRRFIAKLKPDGVTRYEGGYCFNCAEEAKKNQKKCAKCGEMRNIAEGFDSCYQCSMTKCAGCGRKNVKPNCGKLCIDCV